MKCPFNGRVVCENRWATLRFRKGKVFFPDACKSCSFADEQQTLDGKRELTVREVYMDYEGKMWVEMR